MKKRKLAYEKNHSVWGRGFRLSGVPYLHIVESLRGWDVICDGETRTTCNTRKYAEREGLTIMRAELRQLLEEKE